MICQQYKLAFNRAASSIGVTCTSGRLRSLEWPMQSQSKWLRLIFCTLLLCTSLVMTNCGLTTDGPGAVFVDPGKYVLYDCNALCVLWKNLTARQKELQNLIDKAKESAAGGVIGSLAYRTDYDFVVSEEILVQRRAADLKCSITATFKSDDAIR